MRFVREVTHQNQENDGDNRQKSSVHASPPHDANWLNEPTSRGKVVLGDYVANADSPAGREYAEHLGEHGRIVCRQVSSTGW